MKKKALILAIAVLALLSPAAAAIDKTFTLRLGTYLPKAPSNYVQYPNNLWAIEFDQMSFGREDYRGSLLGASFDILINKYFALSFTVDTYNKDRYGYYKDYVGGTIDETTYAFPGEIYTGDSLIHTFNVSVTPIQASVKFTPLGRRGKVIPFVGGGVGLYRYRVSLRGQSVDFSDTSNVYVDPELGDIQIYPVDQSYAEESGYTFGYHFLGGLQFPIGHRITIEGEARYHVAKATLDEWFIGFDKFDVGGLSLTMGINFWF